MGDITASQGAEKLIQLLQTTKEKVINSEDNIAKIHEQGIVTKILSIEKCEVLINGEKYEMPYSSYLTLSKNDVVVITRWNEDSNRRWVTDKMPKW